MAKLSKLNFAPKKFQCAIFDLDGTLLNSTGVWAQIDIDFLGSRGIEIPKDFLETIKIHNFKSGSEYVVKRFNLNEKPEDIAKEWYDMAAEEYANHIELKPKAAEFLHMLKDNGLKLAVATSSDRSLYEPCLKRNGIYDLFDNFTQTDEVERGKGFPDVYYKAAEKCNVKPENCVVFEDILKAVEAAAAGGFYTVAVADKSSEEDEEKIRSCCSLFIENYGQIIWG